MASGKLTICRLSSVEQSDWEACYEANFPESERVPTAQLRDAIGSGKVLLHRTIDEGDGLLCFSVTNPLDTIVLLSYIATDQNKRSGGIGSKHIARLIEELKASHSHMIGLFAEIESTRASGLSEDERKTRKRRLAFYQRLGFKRFVGDYRILSYDRSKPNLDGELLFYPFHEDKPIACGTMTEIIREIYVRGYNLPADDPCVLALFGGSCGAPSRSK